MKLKTLLFFTVMMNVLCSVQSCKNCDERYATEENTVTAFKMMDTTQVIQKISYIGSVYQILPNSYQSDFLLSTSDSITNIILTTTAGIDTISIYQNKNIFFYKEDDCMENDEIQMGRSRPVFLYHTFDSVAIDFEILPKGYNKYQDDGPYHEHYIICVK